jgi:hypothetical protein
MDFFRIYGLLGLAFVFTAFSIWNYTDGNWSWAFVAAGALFIYLGFQRVKRLRDDSHACR